MLVLAFLNLNPHSSKLNISVKIDRIDMIVEVLDADSFDLTVMLLGLAFRSLCRAKRSRNVIESYMYT